MQESGHPAESLSGRAGASTSPAVCSCGHIVLRSRTLGPVLLLPVLLDITRCACSSKNAAIHVMSCHASNRLLSRQLSRGGSSGAATRRKLRGHWGPPS